MEEHQKIDSLDKELIPAEWASLPVLSADQLRVTPPRTAEDIRGDVAAGRFAEMTPDQAG